MQQLKKILILFLAQSLIFNPMVWAANELPLTTPDLEAPEITHTPDTHSVAAGTTHEITAIVSDNVGIKSVSLYYRVAGEEQYQQLQMKNIVGSSEYKATIDNFPDPGIEYYIKASDYADNTLLVGHLLSPFIINAAESIPASTTATSTTDTIVVASEKKPESNWKWLWIGLGVLAVGALASGGGGGDDEEKASVTVSTKVPGEN